MGRLYAPPSKNFVQKTLGADLLEGVTSSATLNNVTGIQDLPGVMIVDRVDQNGTETPNKREVIAYSAISGLTVTTLTRNADGGGSDQDHQTGAIVEFSPDTIWAQAMYDALTQTVDASTGLVDYSAKVMKPTAPYIAVGSDAIGDIYFRGSGGTLSRLPLGTATQVLTANASLPYWAAASAGGGGTAFWSALPTTPAWTAVNQVSIDDVGNAGVYDKLFAKGTLFKWDDGAFKTAMSAGASYASNKVYIGLLGSTLSTLASLPTFKYAIPTLEEVQETFIIPGSLPSTPSTNISKQAFTKGNRYYLGADFIVASGGSGATLTVLDFNDDSVSLFPAGATLHSWLPTLATTSLNIAFLNPETAVAAGSKLTVDCDSTNQTPQTDGYLYVYSYSEGWRYRS